MQTFPANELVANYWVVWTIQHYKQRRFRLSLEFGSGEEPPVFALAGDCLLLVHAHDTLILWNYYDKRIPAGLVVNQIGMAQNEGRLPAPMTIQ